MCTLRGGAHQHSGRLYRLEDSELQLRGVGHSIAAPRRIPNDVHLHVSNTWYGFDSFLDLPAKTLRRGTRRRRQRHADTDARRGLDNDVVHEPKVVDVDWHFGIKDGRECLHDQRHEHGALLWIVHHAGRLQGTLLDRSSGGLNHRKRLHSVDTASLRKSSGAPTECPARTAPLTRLGN